MFYKSLIQIILASFFIFVSVFYLINQTYQKKIRYEYGNNENWNLIKIKSQKIALRYVELVAIILGIVFIALPITFGIIIKITSERLSLIIFNLILLNSMVEYLTLRYFEKRSK